MSHSTTRPAPRRWSRARGGGPFVSLPTRRATPPQFPRKDAADIKVSVISRWYQEEFFAPYFLSHYSFADEIVIMLDKTTTDRSAEIIARYPNARFEYFDHGGVMNDRLHAEMMSDLAPRLKSDWVIYADADEFAFPAGGGDPRVALAQADGTVIRATFRWIYRHITDADLDPTLPAIWQRRHGGPYKIEGSISRSWEMGHVKPCIVRPEAGIKWGGGQHHILSGHPVQYSKTEFDGVHWQMVDVDIAVWRTGPGREQRLSEENKRNHWGYRGWSEEKIRKDCESHLHDPQVF
jgi:hypothetical protein